MPYGACEMSKGPEQQQPMPIKDKLPNFGLVVSVYWLRLNYAVTVVVRYGHTQITCDQHTASGHTECSVGHMEAHALTIVVLFLCFCVEISQPKRLHPNSKIYCPTICSRTLAICLLSIVNRPASWHHHCKHHDTHKSPNNTAHPPTKVATPITAKRTIQSFSRHRCRRHPYNDSIHMPAVVRQVASSPISIRNLSVKI